MVAGVGYLERYLGMEVRVLCPTALMLPYECGHVCASAPLLSAAWERWSCCTVPGSVEGGQMPLPQAARDDAAVHCSIKMFLFSRPGEHEPVTDS